MALERLGVFSFFEYDRIFIYYNAIDTRLCKGATIVS